MNLPNYFANFNKKIFFEANVDLTWETGHFWVFNEKIFLTFL